jgi:hypothetical protein
MMQEVEEEAEADLRCLKSSMHWIHCSLWRNSREGEVAAGEVERLRPWMTRCCSRSKYCSLRCWQGVAEGEGRLPPAMKNR